VPDGVKPSLVIFDIQALWHSAPDSSSERHSTRMSKITNDWHSILLWLYPHGNSGRQRAKMWKAPSCFYWRFTFCRNWRVKPDTYHDLRHVQTASSQELVNSLFMIYWMKFIIFLFFHGFASELRSFMAQDKRPISKAVSVIELITYRLRFYKKKYPLLSYILLYTIRDSRSAVMQMS